MGTIQSTNITIVKTHSSDDTDTYYPEVHYKYIADGVSYESEGVDFIRQSWPSWDKAQSIVNKYPRYSQVRVYYKPENPKLSALKLDFINATIILWAIFGPIMLACAVGFLLGGFGSIISLSLGIRLVFQSFTALFMFATAMNLLNPSLFCIN